MRRAFARAQQRIQGDHPRRPPSPLARAAEVLSDILLAAAAVAFLAGVGVTVWAIVGGLERIWLFAGLGLLAIGPILLLVWERVAWEPVARRLSELS